MWVMVLSEMSTPFQYLKAFIDTCQMPIDDVCKAKSEYMLPTVNKVVHATKASFDIYEFALKTHNNKAHLSGWLNETEDGIVAGLMLDNQPIVIETLKDELELIARAFYEETCAVCPKKSRFKPCLAINPNYDAIYENVYGK